MKTVLICAAQTPFVTGGAEILVEDLRRAFDRRGFRVAVAEVPFKWYPAESVVKQALAWRMLDVTESNGVPIDLLVATKFPTYVVEHPRKVTWLFHQHRNAYDLIASPHSGYTDSPAHREAREALVALDTKALAESRALFAISRNVAARLRRYNGLDATPLYPPPRHLGRYRTAPSEGYFFCAGRLERLKRVDLLIDALALCPAGRLKIAGRGPLEAELRERAERLGVSDRVDFLGFVSDEDLVDLYARCAAALYAPVDEDYGYVTVEAFLSKKPVVTTSDAGGVLEFAEDGVTGFVAAPDAAALAAAMRRCLEAGTPRLREMGEHAHRRVENLSWDLVIDSLVNAAR